MNPLKKYRLGMGLFLAVGLIFAGAILYVHKIFIVFFIANIFFWSWCLKKVKCSQCEQPLAPATGSTAAEIYKSFCSRQCRNCKMNFMGQDA
ncbi:MAG TPA: hypothetical protein VF800_17175 [Telluria sp.]|jgi:hypothetical protein